MNAFKISRYYALIVGLIALVLGIFAWSNSVGFTGEAGIALGSTDFGTLMAVKFIGNRNVATGLIILILFYKQRNEILGYLMLVRGIIDLTDAYWLANAISNEATNEGTMPTLIGATILCVLNFASAKVLIKTPK